MLAFHTTMRRGAVMGRVLGPCARTRICRARLIVSHRRTRMGTTAPPPLTCCYFSSACCSNRVDERPDVVCVDASRIRPEVMITTLLEEQARPERIQMARE